MAGGKFGGGSGTQQDPFLIEDAHDFNAIRIYSQGHHFQLVKDINLNVPPYNTGMGWTPIPYFDSKIDGQGHKISGLRVRSTGEDAGLILDTGEGFTLTNTHFDDFYLEMKTEESGRKILTLLGGNFSFDGVKVINRYMGCSFKGKVNIDAPKANLSYTGILLKETNRSNSAGSWNSTMGQRLRDCLVDLENIGPTPISVFGRIHGYDNYSARVILERAVLKIKGNLSSDIRDGRNKSLTSENSYLIDAPEYNNSLFNQNEIAIVKESQISRPESIPEFVEAAHLGRQTWYFPGTTHVQMVDYSRNKFLLEAQGKIYTYNAQDGLTEIGAAPVLTNMFVDHGIDYIESIPMNVWNGLKMLYGTVNIHCYVEKIPGKTMTTATESLVYDQILGNKIIMRATVNYEDHNNDIVKISIPVKHSNIEPPAQEGEPPNNENPIGEEELLDG